MTPHEKLIRALQEDIAGVAALSPLLASNITMRVTAIQVALNIAEAEVVRNRERLAKILTLTGDVNLNADRLTYLGIVADVHYIASDAP